MPLQRSRIRRKMRRKEGLCRSRVSIPSQRRAASSLQVLSPFAQLHDSLDMIASLLFLSFHQAVLLLFYRPKRSLGA